MAQQSAYSKALSLFKLLKKRPVWQKPLIVQILRQTKNDIAAGIIDGRKIPANITKGVSSDGNSQAVNSTPVEGNPPPSNATKETKLKAKVFRISKVLTTDGGEDFKKDSSILVSLLQDNPIRDDVEVKFPDYSSWQSRFLAGVLPSWEVVQNILRVWVSANGKVATVDQLIRILEREGHKDEAGSTLNILTRSNS